MLMHQVTCPIHVDLVWFLIIEQKIGWRLILWPLCFAHGLSGLTNRGESTIQPVLQFENAIHAIGDDGV